MKGENAHRKEVVLIYEQKKTGKKVVMPLTYHVYDHLTYLSQFGRTAGALPSWLKRNCCMLIRDWLSLEDMLWATRKILDYACDTTRETLHAVPMRLDPVL